ncbi:MAG: hypothetical protein ACERKD_22110 [Prolixibacteraceae bacterium]
MVYSDNDTMLFDLSTNPYEQYNLKNELPQLTDSLLNNYLQPPDQSISIKLNATDSNGMEVKALRFVRVEKEVGAQICSLPVTNEFIVFLTSIIM